VEVVAATLQAIGAGLTACGPGALIQMAISQHTSQYNKSASMPHPTRCLV